MKAIIDGDRLRVATYNIHKCRGLDGRVRPERIVEVLHELKADIIALQEVLSHSGKPGDDDHARFIAEELGLRYCFGENRKHRGRSYGNVLLSRFPLNRACNYDISVPGRERRGCLRVDVNLPGGLQLHVFNAHLGTSILERRQQGRKLASADILNRADLRGARIVLGDFNDWSRRGLTTRTLRTHFPNPHVGKRPNLTRTYPGFLPFFPLDHIYFDPSLALHRKTIHRSRRSLVASDHLPVVAELSVIAGGETGDFPDLHQDGLATAKAS